METSWFGIPDATRKVTELSDMYQKSSASHIKVVLRCTCWSNAFVYNTGNTSVRREGLSDNSVLLWYSNRME